MKFGIFYEHQLPKPWTEEIVRGSVDGIWRVLGRDERLARVYFDLNAVSVVEDDVREVMREIKQQWRVVLSRLLGEADDAIDGNSVGPAAVLVIAVHPVPEIRSVHRAAHDAVERDLPDEAFG